MELGSIQTQVMFEDVAVHFSEGESALLDPDQQALHWEVMEENYRMVASLGKNPSVSWFIKISWENCHAASFRNTSHFCLQRVVRKSTCNPCKWKTYETKLLMSCGIKW
uniref:KRAB domain-containing protein n=1 Tax=Anolis carolinensis TaxID=28377 RepID=A0A803SYT1_ANOCA